MILPTGDIKITADGPLAAKVPNYKEFWYTMVGLAGEGQNFDGNGMYVRFQPGGGTDTLSLGASSLTGEKVFGNSLSKPLGNSPRYPGEAPAVRLDGALLQEPADLDLNGPQAHGTADATISSASTGSNFITRSVAEQAKKDAAAEKAATGAQAQSTTTTSKPKKPSVAAEIPKRLSPLATANGGKRP